MSPGLTVLVCCIAAGVLYEVGKWLVNRAISRRIRAYQARRNQLERNLTAYRALRTTAIEQQPGDPYSDDRIALEQMFIPTQRRTEEDK